ncbi:hypothetical protein C5B85_18025 [Pseudoclavibacter sp. AY1F1]|nr:hypothetical protein C5B85_18025 [Pseudoclavibacter sp. AY1F1]
MRCTRATTRASPHCPSRCAACARSCAEPGAGQTGQAGQAHPPCLARRALARRARRAPRAARPRPARLPACPPGKLWPVALTDARKSNKPQLCARIRPRRIHLRSVPEARGASLIPRSVPDPAERPRSCGRGRELWPFALADARKSTKPQLCARIRPRRIHLRTTPKPAERPCSFGASPILRSRPDTAERAESCGLLLLPTLARATSHNSARGCGPPRICLWITSPPSQRLSACETD